MKLNENDLIFSNGETVMALTSILNEMTALSADPLAIELRKGQINKAVELIVKGDEKFKAILLMIVLYEHAKDFVANCPEIDRFYKLFQLAMVVASTEGVDK